MNKYTNQILVATNLERFKLKEYKNDQLRLEVSKLDKGLKWLNLIFYLIYAMFKLRRMGDILVCRVNYLLC